MAACMSGRGRPRGGTHALTHMHPNAHARAAAAAPAQMAHYANDCWDGEVETSYGWVAVLVYVVKLTPLCLVNDHTCTTNATTGGWSAWGSRTARRLTSPRTPR